MAQGEELGQVRGDAGGEGAAVVLRGTGDMKTPGLALVVTGGLQIPLTGTLTLGWFGLPALGIRGPAVAAIACVRKTMRPSRPW